MKATVEQIRDLIDRLFKSRIQSCSALVLDLNRSSSNSEDFPEGRECPKLFHREMRPMPGLIRREGAEGAPTECYGGRPRYLVKSLQTVVTPIVFSVFVSIVSSSINGFSRVEWNA